MNGPLIPKGLVYSFPKVPIRDPYKLVLRKTIKIDAR
jgi:hypothetical protein